MNNRFFLIFLVSFFIFITHIYWSDSDFCSLNINIPKLIDLDNDWDLDVYIDNSSQRDRLWINNWTWWLFISNYLPSSDTFSNFSISEYQNSLTTSSLTWSLSLNNTWNLIIWNTWSLSLNNTWTLSLNNTWLISTWNIIIWNTWSLSLNNTWNTWSLSLNNTWNTSWWNTSLNQVDTKIDIISSPWSENNTVTKQNNLAISDTKTDNTKIVNVNTWILNLNTNTWNLNSNYYDCPIIKLINIWYPNNFKSFVDINSNPNKDNIIRFHYAWVVNWVNNSNYFKPNENITRAEFLKVLLNSYCIDYSNTEWKNEFKDVSNLDWKYKVIYKSKELSLIDWYNLYGSYYFMPNNNITKMEAVKILTNITFPKIDTSYSTKYIDLISPWQNKYLWFLEEKSVFSSKNDLYKFNPNSNITRAEMLSIIKRFLSLYSYQN